MLLRNIYLFSRSNPPTDIILSNSSIAENSALGTVIGTLTTIDPNINDTFTYSIITDTDNKFILDVDVLKVNGALDYETKTSHDVTIRSTDNKDKYFDKTFTITVTDVVENSFIWLETGAYLLIENGQKIILV